jgi:hypothetical protein
VIIIIFGTLSSVYLSINNKFLSISFFAIAFVYLISNALTVLLIKSTDFNIETITRLTGLAQIAANVVLAYFLICFQKETFSKKLVKYLLYLVLAFALAAVLYSICFQMDIIINSFKAEHATLYQVNSFFSDKNTFGYFLFFGCIAIVLLAELENKKWYYYFAIPLFIFLIISRAKTPLIIVSLGAIALLVYYAITTFKNSKKAWIITFAIIGFAFLLFIILLLVGIDENSPLHQFNYYFTQSIFNDGQATINKRFEKWGEISTLFSSIYCLAGYGERTYGLFLNNLFNDTGIQADNVLITEMLQGGIIKTILYFALFIAIVYRGLKMIDNKKMRVIYIVFAITIAIYGTFEDLEIIASRSYSLLAGALLAFTPSFYVSYKKIN